MTVHSAHSFCASWLDVVAALARGGAGMNVLNGRLSSPDWTPYGAVFEDDGETGYCYAVDTRAAGQSLLDALCVYIVLAYFLGRAVPTAFRCHRLAVAPTSTTDAAAP